MPVKITGSSSGFVNLDAKSAAASNTLTLPDTASGELVAADSSGNINLADNKEIKLGTGGDLQIYHDGSNSYIKDSGTGNLVLATSELSINNAASNEEMIKATQNGAVELYHNNGKAIATTGEGITVTGPDTSTSTYLTVTATGDNTNAILNLVGKQGSGGSGHGGICRIEADSVSDSNGSSYMNFSTRDDQNNMQTRLQISNDAYSFFSTHADPSTGNVFRLGLANRWKYIYLNNAPDVSSDRTLKENITTSDLGLDFVNKLKPVSFTWKDPQSDDKKHYGIIAQDVEQVFIDEGKTLDDFGAISKREGHTMGVAYTEFIAPLLKAVQELSAEVETLKTKVATLEGS